MNHNQQENRQTSGSKPQRPENAPSQLEKQAGHERRAQPREAHEREAKHASDDRGISRRPETKTDKFGGDVPREQQAAITRQGEGGRSRDANNPARQSDHGAGAQDVRRDLPDGD